MQQNVRFQLRNDSVVNWLNSTAPLLPGEPGYAVDTNDLRIGGSNGLPWNQLVSITNRPGPTGIKGPTGPSGGPVGPTGPGAEVYFPPTPTSYQIGNQWIQNPSFNSNVQWQNVAISSTGQYQLASTTSNLYSSSDYGVTWTLNNVFQPANPGPTGTFSTTFTGVAISQTGQYQTAVAYNGYIYYSSNFGAFWNISTAPVDPHSWTSVAIVSSGKVQLAIADFAGLWVSWDYGYSFTQSTAGIPSSLSMRAVATSLTGQYQTVAANTEIYLSSNYGATFQFYNLTNGNGITSVSISSTGQYQTIVSNDIVYNSSDFGASWKNTSPTQIGTAGVFNFVSVSSSGQYQFVAAIPGYMYTSQDFGNTWKSTAATYGSFQDSWQGGNMSSTGQYQTALKSNGEVWISNTDLAGLYGPTGARGITGSDGLSLLPAFPTSSLIGKTWTTNTLGNGIPNDTTQQWIGTAISSTGQYQMASLLNTTDSRLSRLYSSSDYGTSWTSIYFPYTSDYSFGPVAMSATGKYRITSVSDSTGVYAGPTGYTGGVYYSKDYGSNWTLSDLINTVTALAVSKSGQYQLAGILFGYSYLSSNYGVNWTKINNISSNNGISSVAVSASGKYMFVFGNGGLYYISNDYGGSWISKTYSLVNVFSAVSDSGQYLSIGTTVESDIIYISDDYGQTFSTASSPSITWQGIAVSSTGQYQTAFGVDTNYSPPPPRRYVYTSSDYGRTWTQNASMNALTYYQWFNTVSMSSTAQYQLIGASTGGVYSCAVDLGQNIIPLLQNLGATLPSGYKTLAYNPSTGVLGYFGS